MIVPTEQLLSRAENLRRGSRTEGYRPTAADQPADRHRGAALAAHDLGHGSRAALQPMQSLPLPAPANAGS